jgi:hypothetical protein
MKSNSMNLFFSLDHNIPEYSKQVIFNELKRLGFRPIDIKLKPTIKKVSMSDYSSKQQMLDEFTNRKLILSFKGLTLDEVYKKLKNTSNKNLIIDESEWNEEKIGAEYIVGEFFKGVIYLYHYSEHCFINDFVLYGSEKIDNLSVMSLDGFLDFFS